MKVIFVCLGNICRSPMAEGVFNHLVRQAGLTGQIAVDSAGTAAYHVGERPHQGTQKVLQAHGVAYSGRARQVNAADFDPAHWIVAMDSQNMADLRREFGPHPHLHRLLDFATEHQGVQDVPDPYYTGNFEAVYELVLDGCGGLLAALKATLDH